MADPVEVVSNRPAPLVPYSASAIRLYGVLAPGAIVDQLDLSLQCCEGPTTTNPGRAVQLALVYGHSYQGHCYSLPEPVWVAISADHQPQPANGCGYDPASFSMWDVDKLERSIKIVTSADTFEELILNASLPGKRSPQSYSAMMTLSHRGG